ARQPRRQTLALVQDPGEGEVESRSRAVGGTVRAGTATVPRACAGVHHEVAESPRLGRRAPRCRARGPHGRHARAGVGEVARLVSGCAATGRGPTARTGMGRAVGVALVRYSSCEDALRGLRAAAAKAAASAGFSAGADTAAAAGGVTSQGASSSASAGNVSG